MTESWWSMYVNYTLNLGSRDVDAGVVLSRSDSDPQYALGEREIRKYYFTSPSGGTAT